MARKRRLCKSCGRVGAIGANCRARPCRKVNIGCGKGGWSGAAIRRSTARQGKNRRCRWTGLRKLCGAFERRRAIGETTGRRGSRIRSDESRVGKECVRTSRSRWSQYHNKQKQHNTKRKH